MFRARSGRRLLPRAATAGFALLPVLGASALVAVSSQPASAADSRPMAHPATIAATASAPARRRVGSHPMAQRPATIATARPKVTPRMLTRPRGIMLV